MTLQQFNPEEHLTKLPLRRRNLNQFVETRYVGLFSEMANGLVS